MQKWKKKWYGTHIHASWVLRSCGSLLVLACSASVLGTLQG
jgi:hypothetical protein